MKSAWIVACALVLAAAAAPAQTLSEASIQLAAIFGQPAACATRASGVVFAAKVPGPGPQAACTATASCGDDGFVSCQGNSTCSAIDRSCQSQQGRVTCDGVTTLCPACEPCGPPIICCTCQNTGSCFSCCRCDGGGGVECGLICG